MLDAEVGKAGRKLFDGAAGDRVARGPDSKTIAFATKTGLQLWDPDGKQARLVLEKDVPIASVPFAAHGQAVLASEAAPPPNAERARTMLFGVGGGRARKTFVGEALPGHNAADPKRPSEEPVRPADERVQDSALSPDGQWAAAVGRMGGHHQALVWRMAEPNRRASRAPS